MKPRTTTRAERGAALIETAMVLPVLLLLAIGLANMGFAIIDKLTMANAAREGARVGSSAADNTDADFIILRAVEQASCALAHGELVSVEIYKADAAGLPEDETTLLNRYIPDGPLNCTTSNATALVCDNTCPWTPDLRSNVVTDLHDLAVRVTYTHEWVVVNAFVPLSTATWQERATMRLEPENAVFSS
jgi:Flp pilus assembly protein TadG